MRRLLRLSFLVILMCILALSESYALKNQVKVSGRVVPGDVRVFMKDSVYIIQRDYVIGGTLLIEPGTQIYFYANSRMIDSTGGRIIADGYAKAEYVANPLIPASINPKSNSDEMLYPDYPSGKNNPFGYQDYADLNYFLYNVAYGQNDNSNGRTIELETSRDATVNKAKYDLMFYVVLNITNRSLRNLQDPTNTIWDATDGRYYVKNSGGTADKNLVVIPFEQAIMFITARMGNDPNNDIDLRRFSWSRIGRDNQGNTESVNIGSDNPEESKIKFYGQPENNFSREWGHIIVMPGSRAAFFRNCSFEHFKKDTTVDRTPLYNENQTDANWSYINNKLRLLINGVGGVITTLSSRTWILDCSFSNNMARHRGGALAFLQTPALQKPYNFPKVDMGMGNLFDIYNLGDLGRYPLDKNPNITDKDGNLSTMNKIKVKVDGFGNPMRDLEGHPIIASAGEASVWMSRIPAIDLVDEATAEPTFGGTATQADYYRQAFDDGRLAIYLGRVRNNTFENNKVQLANIGKKLIPGTPPMFIVDDYTELEGPYAQPADYPREYGNVAFGGAVYVAGDPNDPMAREIEIGFGVNNSIYINNGTKLVKFSKNDAFEAIGNKARNFQSQMASAGISGSEGARGGAIYVGSNTSMIVAGDFEANVAEAPWIQNDTTFANNGYYARGGAIYEEVTSGRLQVRGGAIRDLTPNNNPTRFINNQAGAGGAIYVDYNINNNHNFMSPIIGGSDQTVPTRDYGYNIIFKDNIALSFGGAIFTRRDFTINGAGGIDQSAQALIGYGGKYPILFENNSAGFVGGALDVRLPIASDLAEKDRSVQIARAVFRDNKVGYSVKDINDLKLDIRGGGAIYTINGSLSAVKGVEFRGNQVKNGNGGAIAMINPQSNTKRFFVTDIDKINYGPNGMAQSYISNDSVFTTSSVLAGDPTNHYPPDARMLTRFLDNKIEWDNDFLKMESGSGTTQIGSGAIGTSENLNSVSFLNSDEGFVVGNNGTIIKLIDGGTQWQFKKGNTSEDLNKVVFLTQNSGFIIGKKDVILKTIDAGDTWEKVNTPSINSSLHGIKFTTSLVGYAVGDGGLILKTTDGGDNWTQISAGLFTNDLFGVDFTDVNYGYVVGERGLIIRTTNAGSTWSNKVSGTLQNLTSVKFTSSLTGYVIGTNGVILKTYDGGNSWNSMKSGTTLALNAFVFSDQNNCYIAADGGNIIKTSNGGERWTPISTKQTTQSLNGIFFLTNNFGYAVSNSGTIIKTTNGGLDWELVEQANKSQIDAKRFHGNGATVIPENGIGLGGAIYILDVATIDRANKRQDSVQFNRVRMQNNVSYTGAAVYSDNYDLKLIFNRSLITGNKALSDIGTNQNAITGPYLIDKSTSTTFNKASSDLAGAIIYGEIQGPLPSNNYHWAANSIYDNNARFLIRLPDAPNSKGVLAGNTGVGFGGTDTLRGNYWGRTEANVTMEVPNIHILSNANMETFFVDTDGKTRLNFILWQSIADRNNLESKYGNLLFQGPFESITRYDYKPIPLLNKGDENTPDTDKSIPEKLLQSGRIYDLYDKGTDIKVADYSKRRMSPIEDFAVGIPPIIDRYRPADTTLPSYGKYIKRYVRDPFIADSMDANDNLVYAELNSLQGEFMPDENGVLYQPIGYPLFLEAKAKYEDGLAERYNLDPRTLDKTVYFIINETTGDFIRVNLKEMTTTSPYFRARVELIPDSADRNQNTGIRRTFEGLLNLGTDAPGGDPKLLKALRQNPYNEDRATLVGRKYENDTASFGGKVAGYVNNRISDLFVNAGGWPESNKKYGTNYATFFAGERYHSLPVDTGDVVRIVSRTVLWREGVNQALNDGLLLKITASTEPALFTGDVYDVMHNILTKEQLSEFPWGYVSGEKDTVKIKEFQNKIFLTEDRMYPVPQYMYSNPDSARLVHGVANFNTYVQEYGDPQLGGNGTTVLKSAEGRDRILNVTAKDLNKYYDPRALFDPNDFAYLYYDFEVASNSGLKHWLFKEDIPTSKSIDAKKWGFSNPDPDSVFGSMILRGRPTNPYVVPGGETLTLKVYNFPPHYRTIDSLKNMENNKPALDTINKFIETFPSYLNAAQYDTTNARYLQQDTINLGKQFLKQYKCKIYVVDSIPIFLDPDAVDESTNVKIWPKNVIVETDIDGDKDTLGTYVPSVYPCRVKKDGRLLANLTNKLRFEADFNTNDELEDKWAENNWDFRYGRTAYGFRNVSLRPNDEQINVDTITVDTTVYAGDTILVQQRPIWMANNFIYKYNSDTSRDEFASDFTIYGKLNIRIDSAMALRVLKPALQYNGALNLDTLFTVVVNDGHGGINSVSVPVMINVEPKILTTSLAPAKEDIDYNPDLRDSTKMIKIFDPNFDQNHWFQLVYDDDQLKQLGLDDLVLPDSIQRDPCFAEAGWHYLRKYDAQGNIIMDLKTTPTWLKINKESGLLYGTPGVKDAPRTEKVTVLVWDEDSLSAIKTFTLRVDSTNHAPDITAAPEVRCVDKGKPYEDVILVKDKDLMRGRVAGDPTETLTVTVLEPTGLTISYKDDQGNWVNSNEIKGIRKSDQVAVKIHTDSFDGIPDQDGRVLIKIQVKDAYGVIRVLSYKVKFSLPTDFVCSLKITNNKGAEKTLQFGTAPLATEGYNLEDEGLGHLDSNYCEYELPPLPQKDIFDARWTIPNSNGIYRNIFLTGTSAKPGEQKIYRGRLQSGGEAGNTSNHYPMTIKWDPNEIPAMDDAVANPLGGTWVIRDAYSSGQIFRYNMKTGLGTSTPDVSFNPAESKLTIISDKIDAFQILYAGPVGVEDQPDMTLTTQISSVMPNPFSNSTKINFTTKYRERIRIEVVDQLGKTVKVITDNSYAPGRYSMMWNGRDQNGNELSSGSYNCRMVAGSVISTKRIVIIK